MNGIQGEQKLESVQSANQLTGIEKKKLNHREAVYRYKIKYPEKYKETIKKCRKNKPDKYREINRRNVYKYRQTLKGKLNNNMCRAVNHSVKGFKNGRGWEKLVNFNFEQLKKHLEKQFVDGMTWENYGKSWHIDHIIPKSAFNYEKPEDEDFKRCWALKNLRPLEALENFKKNAKLIKHFQPSLRLSFQL